MFLRSSVAMPPNRTMLSGHARPFVPSAQRLQHQSSSSSASRVATDRAMYLPRASPRRSHARLSPEAITLTISSNNAFLLAQNFLAVFGTLESYRQDQASGIVETTQDILAIALRSHADPAMFIANTMLMVGTVASLEDKDPDLELAISEFLVSALQRFWEWPATVAAAPPSSLASTAASPTTLLRTSTSRLRFDKQDASYQSSLETPMELDDLIVLNDPMFFKQGDTPMSSLQPLSLQRTGSSAVSLLDEDIGKSPSLLQVAILKPIVPDLIDLSNGDLPACAPSPGSVASMVKKPRSSSVNSYRSVAESDGTDLLTDDSEYELEGHVLQAGLLQRDNSNKLIGDQGSGERKKSSIEPGMEELLEVFDSHLPASQDEVPGLDLTSNKGGKGSIQEQEQQHCNHSSVQQRHRKMLLGEVLSGKSSLQVFAALDGFQLREDLMRPTNGDGSETYGWMLARQLYQRRRFRESSIVVFEYLQRSYQSSGPPASPLPTTFAARSVSGATYGTRASRPALSKTSTSSSSSTSPELGATAATTTVYQLPSTIGVVIVNSTEQLEELAISLRNSDTVGMDTEWLPMIKEFDMLQPATRTAILQLACSASSTVYIVDTIAFLESDTHSSRFVQVIGEFFNSPRILKLAYDWDGDQELLVETFPALYQERYRPRNILDLKHMWFKPSSSSSSSVGQAGTPPPPTPSSYSLSLLSSPPPSPASSSETFGSGESLGNISAFEQWSVFPTDKSMRMIPGGLSGTLKRLCGQRLNKSQQCSNWEQRPLTEEQLIYAAVDAWCLLDIYSAMEVIERV